MIDLYWAPTPNVWKVSIMLEECGLPYRLKPLDLASREQKGDGFLQINPNGRVPAIVDHDAGGQAVFESGAILLYLAEKTGCFLASSGPARVAAFEWLMWQMGGLGPMAGQAHHFRNMTAPVDQYGLDRFVSESSRLYGVLNRRLTTEEWLAGGAYGIADMACWGWVWFHKLHGQDLGEHQAVKRWFETIAQRPAVQRGQSVGADALDPDWRRMVSGPYYGAAES